MAWKHVFKFMLFKSGYLEFDSIRLNMKCIVLMNENLKYN